VAGGQILAFPIDFDRRPYNTLALPCECVMNREKERDRERVTRSSIAVYRAMTSIFHSFYILEHCAAVF